MMDAKFDPARNDYVIRALTGLLGRNPFIIALGYAFFSFGGTASLAYWQGTAVPVDNGTLEFFEDHSNLINCGLILPIAIWLILGLYSRIQTGFTQLMNDDVVHFHESDGADRFIARLDTRINQAWFFWAALVIAVCLNAVFWPQKTDAWNDLSGGPAAVWFRVFVTLNYYMIVHIALKGIVLVNSIRAIFENDVILQPLHPDGCGGLRSLGAMSLSLNYCVCLAAAYVSVLTFVERTPLEHPLFFLVIGLLAAVSAYLFFVPLAKAHDLMEREKTQILSELNREFQRTYQKISERLPDTSIDLKDAQKIESVERLYRIASRMPVWPVDTRIIIQFAALVVLPLIVGLVTEVLKELAGV